jgi:MoaA/NifB/PqqE/SkfB family radical SAM enzyme
MKWLFTDHATSVAIDVTRRCNLRCQHCYWWEQNHNGELGTAEMIGLMKHLRHKGLRAAILYGGEPTLRPEICRAADRIFDAILAFTNGTNGFPELQKGQWILSLDGPKEVNDRIRGEGVYDLAVKNVMNAATPPIVHMTICRPNQDRIEDFVKAMLSLPIKGIGFSFFTPYGGSRDAQLFVPLVDRDRLVSQLIHLRKVYGERVGFTEAMARQLRTDGDFGKWNHSQRCPVRKRVLCMAADGTQKACTYGDQADCTRCGCAAVVAYRGALRPFNWQSMRVVLGLMVPEYRARVSFVKGER